MIRWLTLCLLLGVVPSAAAAEAVEKPVRRVPAVSPGPPRAVWTGTPRPAGSSCSLGEPGPSVGGDFDYLNPASGPDAYYLLLAPQGCPACSAPDSLVLDVVHLELAFPAPCAQPALISVVGATGSGACWAPDTNHVIAPSMTVSIAPDIGGLFDFAFPLPPGVKIASEAFLCVKFLDFPAECSSAQDRPRLRISGACGLCQAYNDYYSSGLGDIHRDDLCGNGLSGRPVLYVTSAQCVVPVLPRTWGALKQHYR